MLLRSGVPVSLVYIWTEILGTLNHPWQCPFCWPSHAPIHLFTHQHTHSHLHSWGPHEGHLIERVDSKKSRFNPFGFNPLLVAVEGDDDHKVVPCLRFFTLPSHLLNTIRVHRKKACLACHPTAKWRLWILRCRSNWSILMTSQHLSYGGGVLMPACMLMHLCSVLCGWPCFGCLHAWSDCVARHTFTWWRN